MSIKDRIMEYCRANGISIRQFEIKSNLSNGYVSSMRKGLGFEKLENVLNAFPDLSRDWLLYGEGKMEKNLSPAQPAKSFALRTDRMVDRQEIPLFDISAAAGLTEIFQDAGQEPVSFLKIPDLPPVDGAVYVRGNSMYPLLKSGDIIIYKKVEPVVDRILWGQIYLLSYTIGADSYTVVKYIKHAERENYIRLVSYNDFYEPVEIPASSVRALALVKASITFLTMQ